MIKQKNFKTVFLLLILLFISCLFYNTIIEKYEGSNCTLGGHLDNTDLGKKLCNDVPNFRTHAMLFKTELDSDSSPAIEVNDDILEKLQTGVSYITQIMQPSDSKLYNYDNKLMFNLKNQPVLNIK